MTPADLDKLREALHRAEARVSTVAVSFALRPEPFMRAQVILAAGELLGLEVVRALRLGFPLGGRVENARALRDRIAKSKTFWNSPLHQARASALAVLDAALAMAAAAGGAP